MYETFFGLKRRPFLAVPDTESYFSIPRMEEARQSIERIVRRGEGISLVVGPSGTGKTLLLRLLRKAFDVEYTVSLIANGHLETPKAFFQQLLYELRLPFSSAEETELRLILQDFARQETTPGIVLLIDEAQFLGPDVLEEIRLLMNADDGAVPFFRAILAGTVAFEEKLTHPKFEAFNQRIAARFYLDSFTREESFQYIAWQTGMSRTAKENLSPGLAEFINHSGSIEGRRLDAPHVKGDEPIFTEKARFLIFKLTEGLPRLVNQLCDASLQLAAERIARQVDETLVQGAWAKLQRIDEASLESVVPQIYTAPENTESIEEIVARKKATFRLKKFDSAVEFGTLDTETSTRSPSEYKPPYPGDDEPGDESVEAEPYDGILYQIIPLEPVSEETVESERRPGPVCYPMRCRKRAPSLSKKPGSIFSFTQWIMDIQDREIFSGEIPATNGSELTRRTEVPDRLGPRLKAQLGWGDFWIGNVSARPRFFPVRLFLAPIEIEAEEIDLEVPDAEAPFEETPMDQETLEKYGSEVLEGRPPFVRKEPNYAYRTTDSAPERKDVLPYPDPVTGSMILLNWIVPGSHDFDCGTGTAYREFVSRPPCEIPKTEASADCRKESVAAAENFELFRVVRVDLGASDAADPLPRPMKRKTSLDESFDEIVRMKKTVVSLEEVFRPAERPCVAETPREIVVEDTEAQRRLDAAVRRITEAAEKIEQAAGTTEDAGRQIKRSADFVETEIQAALPTYKELFVELSEFQKTISAELRGHQKTEPVSEAEPPPQPQREEHRGRLLPFPRRPDFIPPEQTHEIEAVEPVEEERSIDVRTLFQ